MQTTPEKGKGRRVSSATTPMQTEKQFRTSANPAQPFQQKLERPPRPLTDRQSRAVNALLIGPVPTNQMPRIAGANNANDLVVKLRRKLGVEIPCPKGAVVDRDGHTVQAGEWSLTADDRAKIDAFLLAQARRAA